MTKDQIAGLISLILGIVVLWLTIRYPNKSKLDPLAADFKGYLGGFSFILIGICLLFGRGKLL
jgi:hypothetical protein